jgi:enoyl-CoA hydratase
MDAGIRYQYDSHVATITIDRPDRRNALAQASLAGLADAFVKAGTDSNVRVILLTGSGVAAFSAGADLKEADELALAGRAYPMPMSGTARNVFELILETPKPTVAALNGVALGAGCELGLACDVRIAAQHALIGLPEAKRGMGANFASVVLPRLIPRALALDMLYTGRTIDSEEALRIGLVCRVFPTDIFIDASRAYAAEFAANAPLTLQRYKHQAIKGWELPIHSALRLDVGPNPYASEDRIEGVRAFIEKRAPVWRGH